MPSIWRLGVGAFNSWRTDGLYFKRQTNALHIEYGCTLDTYLVVVASHAILKREKEIT